MDCKIASGLVLLSISLMAGCHSGASAPDTSIPITEKMLPTIRDSYTRTDNTVKVGLVTAVSAANNTAMVGDLSATDFNFGDYYTFVDSNHNILTMGKAQSFQGGSIIVQFNPPAKGSRIPKIGDLAIHTQIPE